MCLFEKTLTAAFRWLTWTRTALPSNWRWWSLKHFSTLLQQSCLSRWEWHVGFSRFVFDFENAGLEQAWRNQGSQCDEADQWVQSDDVLGCNRNLQRCQVGTARGDDCENDRNCGTLRAVAQLSNSDGNFGWFVDGNGVETDAVVGCRAQGKDVHVPKAAIAHRQSQELCKLSPGLSRCRSALLSVFGIAIEGFFLVLNKKNFFVDSFFLSRISPSLRTETSRFWMQTRRQSTGKRCRWSQVCFEMWPSFSNVPTTLAWCRAWWRISTRAPLLSTTQSCTICPFPVNLAKRRKVPQPNEEKFISV